ncbi:MAG: hypothetical protein P8M53_13275 [Pirellulales bacterium]|nr:hypothetical protein [Pirellulales bacterium]
MDEIKREELISAYLDGELNPSEAEYTKKCIAEDPRAKKLFEELKILQDAIHELPKHHLESDLTQPVLDHIVDQPVMQHYSMLDAEEIAYSKSDEEVLFADHSVRTSFDLVDAAKKNLMAASETPQSGAAPKPDRRRVYLWPAVAIAAAVLLMVFSRPDPVEKERSVVRTDAAATAKAPRPQYSLIDSLELKEDTKSKEGAITLGNIRPEGITTQSRSQEFGLSARDAPAEDALLEESPPPRAKSAINVPQNSPTVSPKTKLLTTYFFNTVAEIDSKLELENIIHDDKKLRLIDLGAVRKEASTYRVFELYGDPVATRVVTEALKNSEGMTFASQKTLRSEDLENRGTSTRRSIKKLQRLEKSQAFIAPDRGGIRIIFIEPTP